MAVRSTGGWRERGGSAIEHYALTAMIVTNVVLAISVFLPDTLLYRIVTNTVGLSSVVAILLMLKHHGRLCLRCMRESPTDASVRAVRRRPWLWLYHCTGSFALNLAVLMTYLVGMSVAATLQWSFMTNALNVAISVVLAVVFIAMRVHRPLVIWCPWCRGGGEEEQTPTPAPDPALTKFTS